MPSIPVIFDGKNFVPKHPVSLPAQSEAVVIVEDTDRTRRDALDAEVRAYYQSGPDVDDDAWGTATFPQSKRAWDED